MAVTIKGVIPAAPDTSDTEATLNIKIRGGEGQEADGFISVQMASSLLSGITAGDCTLTVTQP